MDDLNQTYQLVNGREVTGAQVLAYIQELKEHYLILRRRIWPSLARVSSHEDHLWLRAALKLLAAEAPPANYLQYVFERASAFSADVWPRMVTSDNFVEQYIAQRPDQRAALEQLIKLQAEQVQVQRQSGRSLEQVLLDPVLPLSAIFRFALAWSEGRLELAQRFRGPAEEMLVREPHYRQLLAKWLPEDLQHGAS